LNSSSKSSSITNDEILATAIVIAEEDQLRNVDDGVRYFTAFYQGKNLIKPSPCKINI
jgi:hypothetical protein